MDVGFGNGRAAVQICTDRGLNVVGITISDHQLQLARARAHDEGLPPERVSFQLADAMELPFEDSSFDGAYAIESLVHMQDKQAALGHLARVLRPGARLVVADAYQNESEIRDEDADLVMEASQLLQFASLITADMYRECMHRAGLRLVEFTDIRENIQNTYNSLFAAFREGARTVSGEASSQLTAIVHLLERAGGMSPQVGYMLLTAARI